MHIKLLKNTAHSEATVEKHFQKLKGKSAIQGYHIKQKELSSTKAIKKRVVSKLKK